METQVQQFFIIDRTPFAISFNNLASGDINLFSPPSISYNIQMATGVKEAKFFVRGRSVNYRYVPSGQASNYPCDSVGICTNSGFQQEVFSTEGHSGSFTIPFYFDGGIYDKIYYEVTPNFGAVRTGEFSLTKKIKYIKNSSQDLRVMAMGSSSLMFMESIISNRVNTSGVLLRSSATFNEMCRVNDNYFYGREQVKSPLSISTSIGDDYGSIVISRANVKYRYLKYKQCDVLDHCPATFGSCQNPRPSGSNKVCLPLTSTHYSDGFYEGGYSCENWETPSNYGNWMIPLYYVHCEFYRDLTYINSAAYIRINDTERAANFPLRNYFDTTEKEDCL